MAPARSGVKVSPAAVVSQIPANTGSAFAVWVDKSGDVGLISLVAGGMQKGMQDGRGSAALLSYIEEMTAGPDGNIYLADGSNAPKFS